MCSSLTSSLRPGSYPTVSSHSGEWALNPSSHSLDWSIPTISPDDRSGSLEFTVGGDDTSAFFPVKVSFVGQGSVAGITAANVTRMDNGEEAVFSADSIVTTDTYVVV
jgi:coatomer subunit delta